MNTSLRKFLIGLTMGLTMLIAVSFHYRSRISTLSCADAPRELSGARWKAALRATIGALKDKELTTQAAALAYYGTFAFFPTLVAFIAIFSLVISRNQLAGAITAAEAYLPPNIASVISTQLESLTQQPEASIIAAVLSIAVALFGASGGAQNLLRSLNHAYNVEETRGFVKQRLLSVLFVLGGFLVAIPVLGLLVMQSDVLVSFGGPAWSAVAVATIRWVLVAAIISVALAALYRYGPDRKNPKWQWVSWGAIAATVVWAVGSGLFFFYLQNFASFASSYGLFAGIIALMLWLNVSSLILLLGAEVNYRLERQTNASTKV